MIVQKVLTLTLTPTLILTLTLTSVVSKDDKKRKIKLKKMESYSIVIPVRCNSQKEMFFIPPSIDQFMALHTKNMEQKTINDSEGNKEGGVPERIFLNSFVTFQMVTATEPVGSNSQRKRSM
jgi:hypothetical protein